MAQSARLLGRYRDRQRSAKRLLRALRYACRALAVFARVEAASGRSSPPSERGRANLGRSNSLEAQGADDAQEEFESDFVEAWTKVMTLDRFDAPTS